MRESDSVAPDCERERGCRIPPLASDELRVMKMHEMLIRLSGLVDSSTVLNLFGAKRDDLELLAIVEEEIVNDREAER